MSLYAVMVARDEADVIGWTLAHLQNQGVERVLLIDNGSEDDTAEIAERYDFCHVISDPTHGHYQGERTTRLARMAHDLGAEWVLPVDADELFYAKGMTLAERFDGEKADTVMATVWDHIVTDDDDPTEPNPYKRTRWRRQSPQRLAKVAFRASDKVQVAEGNHDVKPSLIRAGGLYARHLQYRSYEQMVRKVRQGAAAMDAAGVHPLHGTHWREAAKQTDDELFLRWRKLCEERGLVEDPCPW